MAETKDAPKKLYIKTYGCQMNVYDSERMAEALGGKGYTETQSPDDADMILLNTCHIREKAAEKVYSELGRYKDLKADGCSLPPPESHSPSTRYDTTTFEIWFQL